jgi:cytochrome c oxidase assembly protein subunit 15
MKSASWERAMENAGSSDRSMYVSTLLGSAVWGGFAVSLPLWLSWYVTHLPWLKLSEQQALPIVLGAWLIGLALAIRLLPAQLRSAGGLAMGGTSALIGFLVLGSKLVEPASAGEAGANPSVVPQWWLICVGFIILGLVLGGAGSVLARLFPRHPSPYGGTLPGMAWASVLLTLPLMFAGGLVTSTDSGMAVPDWPNTFGSNMFLYPIGPRVQGAVGEPYEAIFLEHAHRLFGALVGFSSLCLTIWVLRAEQRRWLKILTIFVFACVVAQGLLGGERVVQDKRVLALIHGVSAQLILAGLVVIATSMTRPVLITSPLPEIVNHGRIRILTAAAGHSTILQLIFGAAYRHFRETKGGPHALLSHIGFSFVVLALTLIAGALASGAGKAESREHSLVSTVRKVGGWMMGAVGLQFALGWVAFLAGGKGVAAPTAAQALVRTAHQANGALMLAVIVAGVVLTRCLSSRLRAQADAGGAGIR